MADSRSLPHEFDSSNTCNYCGRPAERVGGSASPARCPARSSLPHHVDSTHHGVGDGQTATLYEELCEERRVNARLREECDRLKKLLNAWVRLPRESDYHDHATCNCFFCETRRALE